MSSFTVLRHVEHLFAVQFNVFISYGFYLLFTILCFGFYCYLLSFFSDATDIEHS